VADTGRGFAEASGSGVGLANIKARLATLYGERATLRLEANSPRGVVAIITLPLP
jgi:LytS/YehU family sensor histidine kinase